MPEIFVDTTNFELYKQVEIRSPTPRGYFFDIVWIKASLAKKNNTLSDADDIERVWTVAEVYGAKRLPGSRGNYKVAK